MGQRDDHRPDRGAIDAVSLDVGGVLVVPDHGLLAHALDGAGIEYDRARFGDGHYSAMAAVDRCRSRPEEFTDYTHGFLQAVGVPAAQLEAAVAVLEPWLIAPIWCQPLPGALVAARRLAAAGLRLAVTSNSDGSVADMLARHEYAQVGEGPGVPVEHIGDSAVVGFAKPHPLMFETTAAALGLPLDRVCHIGDSGTYDADGASAAGMRAVHVDPLGLCPAEHHHAASLATFADEILNGT
ncbi:MAG TPA: HAD family hydrolase [Acidimicrobiales bacterium]|nr:HAD family hydrolase [Acidimicrobiales bacterium]